MSVDRTELDIRIIEYLYGEHDEPGRAALRAEIDADDLLRNQLNEWLEVDALLAQLPDEEPDPRVAQMVMDAARDEVRTPAFNIWEWLQKFSAAPAFAAIFLLVVGGGLLFELTGQFEDTAPSASKSLDDRSVQGAEPTPLDETDPSAQPSSETQQIVEPQPSERPRAEMEKRSADGSQQNETLLKALGKVGTQRDGLDDLSTRFGDDGELRIGSAKGSKKSRTLRSSQARAKPRLALKQLGASRTRQDSVGDARKRIRGHLKGKSVETGSGSVRKKSAKRRGRSGIRRDARSRKKAAARPAVPVPEVKAPAQTTPEPEAALAIAPSADEPASSALRAPTPSPKGNTSMRPKARGRRATTIQGGSLGGRPRMARPGRAPAPTRSVKQGVANTSDVTGLRLDDEEAPADADQADRSQSTPSRAARAQASEYANAPVPPASPPPARKADSMTQLRLQADRERKAGRWRAAIERYERYLRLSVSTAERQSALMAIGECHEKLGSPERAIAAYQKVVALGGEPAVRATRAILRLGTPKSP